MKRGEIPEAKVVVDILHFLVISFSPFLLHFVPLFSERFPCVLPAQLIYFASRIITDVFIRIVK